MVKPPIQRNATINSTPKEKEIKTGATSKLRDNPFEKSPIDPTKINTSTETSFNASVKPVEPSKQSDSPKPIPSTATVAAATQPPPSQPPPSQKTPLPQQPIQQTSKAIPSPVQIQHVPTQLFKVAKWVILFAGIGYGIANLSSITEQTKIQEASNKTKKGKPKKGEIDDAEKDAMYSLFGSETND